MSAPATGALDRATAAAERGATLVLRGHADPDSPWQPVRLVIVWLLTRLVVVMIVPVAPFVVGDVNYYATVLTGQADADFPGTLREYPVPALWVLKLPAILAGNEIKAYGWWFVFVMIVVDGLFLLALQRIGRAPRAVTAWLVAGVAIGPLLVLRFDLLTGAAVAVAVLVSSPRPRLAAALMVVATGIKLWPGVLVGLVGASARPRRAYVRVAALTSLTLVAASLLTHGWERLLTPLSYQTDRGLQVESLSAFPFLVLRSSGVSAYRVVYGASLSDEVDGPGTHLVGLMATLAAATALTWVLYVTASLWRRPQRTDLPTAAAWALLSSVALLVLSNKVFSPQYMAWLLPLVVVVLAITRERAARTCTWLMIVAAVAAQVLYPWLYLSVTEQSAGPGNVVAVGLIGTRLALVGIVAWIATRRTWQLVRADAPDEEPATTTG